jgi:diaminopimelate epimerase
MEVDKKTTTMRFTKMHGAGNDYVYVNCFDESLPEPPERLALKISDRHFGVGGDGLILICPSRVADARMRIFNADGSEAEMCGNGIRCVAKYVYDHGICRNETLKIETGAGVLSLDVLLREGRVERVRVDMGQPVLQPDKIPVLLPAGSGASRVVNVEMSSFIRIDPQARWPAECHLDPRITCVSMGNPHLVLYCGDVSAVPLETVGPMLETEPAFPRRINVHFVQVHSPTEVTMRTWERGSGITLACGTGASAVCVAGVLTERSGREMTAHLPGGDLQLDWNAKDDHVYMTGPATEVFSGQWLMP